jgi:hypothetical protein
MFASETPYPSGATLPSNPENGQLFNHNDTYKMWNGTDAVKNWVTGNFTGSYDTLFLFRLDGVTPANLDLGTLYAHDSIFSDCYRMNSDSGAYLSVISMSAGSYSTTHGIQTSGDLRTA